MVFICLQRAAPVSVSSTNWFGAGVLIPLQKRPSARSSRVFNNQNTVGGVKILNDISLDAIGESGVDCSVVKAASAIYARSGGTDDSYRDRVKNSQGPRQTNIILVKR